MQIKQAVVTRFKSLCEQRGIKYNELATLSGITPSTVYIMMDENRKNLSIITVKKLCEGLEISISEFFDCDIFQNLEQEIM